MRNFLSSAGKTVLIAALTAALGVFGIGVAGAVAGQETGQWSEGKIVKASTSPSGSHVSAALRDGAAFTCKNELARTLHRAGFRDENLHFAWAIAMRESNGRNLDESSRYFTGALGIFQIQTEAWSGRPWWSRSAMLNPDRQARIVYKRITRGGKDWSHWGLNADGSLNATHYQGWSAQMRQNWIINPFRKYYKQYPCS